MVVKCDGCGDEFPSRNAVFRHLKETQGACLPAKAYADFSRYVLREERKKVVVLYGYYFTGENEPRTSDSITNGAGVARVLLQTLQQVGTGVDDVIPTENGEESTLSEQQEKDLKINRSYGNNNRSIDILAQEDYTGAVTEVLATRLPAMICPLEKWLDKANELLRQYQESQHVVIRVLGRQDMPHPKFNAEMNVSHRRIEYLLPADFLSSDSQEKLFSRLPTFSDGFHSKGREAAENIPRTALRNPDHSPEAKVPRLANPTTDSEFPDRPDPETLTYLYALKKKMQSLTTQIVELDENDETAVMIKNFNTKKRLRNRYKGDYKGGGDKSKNGNQEDEEEEPPNKKGGKEKKKGKKGQRVLKRRRFHNFTPKVMAHDYLAYRRMDRMYHRATLRFPDAIYDSLKLVNAESQSGTSNLNRKRPFLSLSMNGDIFLHGQACRVVGVLVALARGLIDEDFIECVFDEAFPTLVPTPEAPIRGMYAAEVFYVAWEGKTKSILTPRICDRFKNGWNDTSTLERVQSWQQELRNQVAKTWLEEGEDPTSGRLIAEKTWIETVLEPWAKKAQQQLQEYRQWKEAGQKNGKEEEENLSPSVTLPPLDSIDRSVPEAYKEVVELLRKADASGQWPATTPKRQLVMISNLTENESSGQTDESKQADDSTNKDAPSSSQNNNQAFSSLSMAFWKAKSNKVDRSSAYDFAEGFGGASGSFSVGAMPGLRCIQPKANTIFPELVKAAFQLERVLCPEREPSSTIAINRNAQFRPHTDSGAGAGQSSSLIVALGDFVGGELVVEGNSKDIRYNPIEFNGWTQRHWTMPFKGERFSLVWFTPKGCEGVRGIDL